MNSPAKLTDTQFAILSEAAAKDTGMRILYVVDTHIHADHASAGRRLAEAAGAKYVLFAGAEASPAFRGVSDGDVLELGNVTAEALHVPGHTPEHIKFLPEGS